MAGKGIRPGRGGGMSLRLLRRPSGADALGGRFRWLTPPANFRCPSGTTDFPAPLLITPEPPVGVQRLHVLDFDTANATAWARLLARLKKKGRAMPVKDSLIAATALAHGLTVATRNTADFRHAGVPVENPFP